MPNRLPTSHSLLILQWNCNGVSQRRDELELVLVNRRIDVALLSETHLTPNQRFYIHGYTCYRTDHPDHGTNGRAHGGTAILVKTSLVNHVVHVPSDYVIQCTAISISTFNFPFILASVYCPPRFVISTQSFNDFFSELGPRFIAAGDYNSKHQQWGSRLNNPRGRNLMQCLIQNNLKVLSPNEFTYWPTAQNRQPDLLDFFVERNVNLYHKIDVVHELSSDHSSLLLSLGSQPLPVLPKPSLTCHRNDWNMFRTIVNDKLELRLPLKCQDEIELAIEHFVETIQHAAWNSKSPHTASIPSLPIYPTYIRHLITEKRKARKRWQLSRHPSLKREYNRINNNLKALIKNYKKNNYERYISSLCERNGSLWKATKQVLKHHSVSPPLRRNDGSWASADDEKATMFAEHLVGVFQPNADILNRDHCTSVQQVVDSPLQLEPPAKNFTPSEIMNEILHLPLKKAPGYDLITSEVLRELPRKGIVFLTQIFNSILRVSAFPIQWKHSTIKMILKPGKPPHETTSYRPISLLPVCSKLFEKLLYRRLLPIISQNNILPNHQYGFRHQHSTLHQLHRICDYVATSLERKEYASGVFFDVSQAFDKVWHEGLLSKLRFLPTDYYLVIQSFLRNRFFSVSQGSVISSCFPISAGVPQGAILSPLLYMIYTSDIPSTQNTIVASFADDTAILSSSLSSIQSSQYIQYHLSILQTWLTNWRIKININKTWHITFTLRRDTCPPVFLFNQQLPSSTSIKYLGLHYDRRLTWNEHVRNKRLTLDNRFKQLYRLLSRRSKLPIASKLIIYKYLLRPIWTYGGYIYGCAKPSTIAKIQRFQSKALRTLLDAPYYVSNETIHNDLQIPYVNDVFIRHYRRFKEKLIHHPNTLIRTLSSRHLPGNPRRRLKRRWSRDLLL
jgi:hypothetical protein